jgi:hypothetical protein
MSRKLVLASGAFAIAMILAGIAFGSADDYAFEPVKAEIKASNVATLAVRLIHKATQKPVTNAVIVQTRIEMAPDESHQMTSAIAALPSPEPGVFAFKAPLAMEGRWLLSIAAKVPGEPDTVQGKIIFRTTH